MPITYNVHSGVQVQDDIRFTLQGTPDHTNVKAGGQMITDSDTLSFVYLLEDETGYHYVKFGRNVWPLLVNTLKATNDPTLQFGDLTITLHMFREELEMLIFNIEGNDNYWTEFSHAVEETFTEILKA